MENTAIFIIFFVGFATNTVLASYKVFEEDQSIDGWYEKGWRKRDPVEIGKTLEISFALKQQNVEQFEELFWRVSDPDSSCYGDYLTTDQITAMIAPRQESIDAVASWLSAHGVSISTECRLVANRDYLNCNMTSGTAEKLLQGAKFFYFEHHNHPSDTGRVKREKKVIRAINHYHIHHCVSDHLDFVVGVHRFPSITHKKKHFTTEPSYQTTDSSNARNFDSSHTGASKSSKNEVLQSDESTNNNKGVDLQSFKRFRLKNTKKRLILEKEQFTFYDSILPKVKQLFQ